MKKYLIIFMIILTPLCFAAPAKEVVKSTEFVEFTDSCGRTVNIPKNITKVSPAGPVATSMLECIAPEYLCSVSGTTFLPELAKLPKTGSLFGGKNTINYEELLRSGTQLIIDMGDLKKGHGEDLDTIQKQTGIPCIFIEADLKNMAKAFSTLGEILFDKKERASELSTYVESILQMAGKNRALIDKKISVMYSGNADGLGTNAKGSSQAQVIEIIGAENAVVTDSVANKNFGNVINMETLYSIDPEIILFAPGSIYGTVANNPAWQILSAVKTDNYHEVPDYPYCWMGNPSSVNMILGIIWLGNIVYPQYYDYNVDKMISEACRILWNTEITE